MTKTIWISFDFGMKGDYEGLYVWLDKNNALERGYGLALIKKISVPKSKIIGDKKDLKFKNYLRDEIKKYVRVGKSDRIYMIWRSIEDNGLRGSFLFGGSKAAPWKGYSQIDEDTIDLDFE